MKFDRYKYYQYVDKKGRQVVVAVSRHAGRTIKGYAICDPADEFDLEVGKKLAAARCNQKVLSKKVNECEDKLLEIDLILEDLKAYRSLIASKCKNYSKELCDSINEIAIMFN